jgi:RNA methyltransferase, TrmH family
MITSPQNEQLKTIRKLQAKRHRERTGLFAAEGEDLVDAAAAAGWPPETVLRAGLDVEPELLDAVSSLGSGTRAVGVYRQRFSQPDGSLSVYLDGVGDPGNVGAVIRAAHALCDGPVILGPGCADPYAPKAVRASMGSVFARPPAQAGFGELSGARVALDPAASSTLSDLELAPPLVLCLGAEREGLRREVLETADARARIPVRAEGPESLGVAAAAAIALYEAATRMAAS